jgi:hypothetical protein
MVLDRLRELTGLPARALLALAALGLPRAVLHDLSHGGDGVNLLLSLAPPALWLAVVVRTAGAAPFTALLVIGLLYGIGLAAAHQLLWHEAHDGDPPRLGDNLADAADWVHATVTRTAAVVSSVLLGTALGAVLGAVATPLHRLRHGPRAAA